MKKLSIIALSLMLIFALASCDVVAGEVDKLVTEATAPLVETIETLEATKTELENAKATLETAKATLEEAKTKLEAEKAAVEVHGLIKVIGFQAYVAKTENVHGETLLFY